MVICGFRSIYYIFFVNAFFTSHFSLAMSNKTFLCARTHAIHSIAHNILPITQTIRYILIGTMSEKIANLQKFINQIGVFVFSLLCSFSLSLYPLVPYHPFLFIFLYSYTRQHCIISRFCPDSVACCWVLLDVQLDLPVHRTMQYFDIVRNAFYRWLPKRAETESVVYFLASIRTIHYLFECINSIQLSEKLMIFQIGHAGSYFVAYVSHWLNLILFCLCDDEDGKVDFSNPLNLAHTHKY